MTADPNLLLDRVRAATVDEYIIEGELGRGGMAAVFLGRDIALHRRVAIKVMLPDLVRVAGVQDRFLAEARTAAQLDHPGIVSIFAVKQSGGLPFMVMKYIEGRTLDRVLAARGTLDSGVVATIGSHVAEALYFAHSHGVVHRDVKPSNIIIEISGRPVVVDFGIAKVSTEPSLTMAGATIGTPSYMSPEQCLGLPVTPASDQYSLGVVLYEMLVGRVPFSGTLFETLKAHTSYPVPPIRSVRPEVDPALEGIVTTMLAKNEDERFPSLRDVAKALLSVGPRRSQTAEWQTITAAVAQDLAEPPRATPAVPAGAEKSAIVAGRASSRPNRLKRIVVPVFGAIALLAAVGYAIMSRATATKTAPPPEQARPTQAATVDSTPPTKSTDSVSAANRPPDTTANVPSVAASRSNAVSTQTPAPPAPAKTGSKRDSAAQARTDSIAGRCAALNLKFSVGEDVTRADSLFLQRDCARHRP